MATVIIGADGFIGKNLMRQPNRSLVGITRENYQTWKDKLKGQVDKAVWAAGLSSKVRCQEEEELCYQENVKALAGVIRDFQPRQLVYISSYDVYSASEIKDETGPDWALFSYDFNRLNTYGQYKYWGEQVAKSANSWLIVRANGFTGPGLKKNAVFDLAQDPPQLFISHDSKIQYIHVDIFTHILFSLADKYNNDIFNVTSVDAISPPEIAEILGKDIRQVQQPKDRVVPRVESIMSTDKMEAALTDLDIEIPSSVKAVEHWNEPLQLSCEMYCMFR